MTSAPMLIRFDDGSETRLRVTSRVTPHRSTLRFLVDEAVVAERHVYKTHPRATFRHRDRGTRLRVQCMALGWLQVGASLLHRCTVRADGAKIGQLDVTPVALSGDGA